VVVRGTQRITVNACGFDLCAPSSFNGFIQAQDQDFSLRHQNTLAVNQAVLERLSVQTILPNRETMILVKPPFISQTHKAQRCTHRMPAKWQAVFPISTSRHAQRLFGEQLAKG